MSIRSQKILFLRFAILALFAGFSSHGFATSGFVLVTSNSAYTTGQCFSSQSAACGAAVHTNTQYYWSATPIGNSCVSFAYSNNAQAGTALLSSCTIPTCQAGETIQNGLCSPNQCPSGKTFNEQTLECDWPTSCPAGYSLFTTTNSGGSVASASCIPQVQTPTGQPCITYSDMQTAACQSLQSSCTSSGGTFGNVNGNNVCIPPGDSSNPPTCASGGTQLVVNPDGSSSVVCVGTSNLSGSGTNSNLPKGVTGGSTESTSATITSARTANNTAEIARINAAGFEAVVNAIKGQGPNAGGGGGEGDPQQGETGPCDPSQANYAQCIKQTEEVGDGEAQSKIDSASSSVSDTFDTAKNGVTDLLNGESGAEEPSSVTSAIDAMIPNSVVSCSDISFSFRGHTMLIQCAKFEPLRDILAWVFAVLTAITCFQIAFAPRSV